MASRIVHQFGRTVVLFQAVYRPQQRHCGSAGSDEENNSLSRLAAEGAFCLCLTVSGSKLELWIHTFSRQVVNPLFGKLRCWWACGLEACELGDDRGKRGANGWQSTDYCIPEIPGD
jgi:hypothetical protein